MSLGEGINEYTIADVGHTSSDFGRGHNLICHELVTKGVLQ